MSALTRLLSPESIVLDASAADWRDAIQQAGSLLENAGHCTPDYTQSMIDTVAHNGPYIVLTPGLALAHARPSAAVQSTGLSFLRLSTPISFGHPKNDPVSIVIALAAADKTQHLDALSSLSTVLANSTRRAGLDKAATVEEVLELLDVDKQHRSEPQARNKILTVCGNGLGTSLFLKNTLESGVPTSPSKPRTPFPQKEKPKRPTAFSPLAKLLAHLATSESLCASLTISPRNARSTPRSANSTTFRTRHACHQFSCQ